MKNILFLSFLIITGCMGRSIDNSPHATLDDVGHDKVVGDTVAGDLYVGRDKVAGDKVESVYQAPSYRNATIVQGNEGAAIPVSDKSEGNNLITAIEMLGKISKGKDVEPQEAYDRMFSNQFFILSGTEVSVLESNESSKGLGGVIKVRILEGAHKDKKGWVSVSLIKTERRLVSK